MEVWVKIILVTGVKVAIVLLMAALGAQTTRDALLRLWRDRRLLAGSLVAAFVVVPLVAYGVLRTLPLPFGIKAGLWAIAITPGAPMLYRTALSRRVGDPELAASFQVTVALLVVVFAPIWLVIVSALSGGDYWVPLRVVLRQVAEIQLLPMLVGLALHRWKPGVVERATPVVVRVDFAVLIVLVLAILVAIGPRVLTEVRVWTVVAAALVAAAALAGGHLLAGPQPATRLTIADANAQRNPGLALTLTAWSVSQHQGAAVVAVVVYVFCATLLTAVYTKLYARSVL